MVIDVNSLIAYVSADADEGDAIDSNGTLTINGGTIIAIAHPTSPDAGLDSGKGTYINGGTVIATGNMMDAISNESKQKYLYASFNTIEADTLIVIKDQDDNIITAFKTDRSIQNILYSSADLDYESFKIYTGGTIDGEETNGLYTKINSYENGDEITYNSNANGMMMSIKNNSTKNNNISDVLLKVLIGEIATLTIFVIGIGIAKKKKKDRD